MDLDTEITTSDHVLVILQLHSDSMYNIPHGVPSFLEDMSTGAELLVHRCSLSWKKYSAQILEDFVKPPGHEFNEIDGEIQFTFFWIL